MVRRRGREMVGHLVRRQDSSFLCLLAIYATHVVLFHVFDVTPFFGTKNFRLDDMARSHFGRMLHIDNDHIIVMNINNNDNNRHNNISSSSNNSNSALENGEMQTEFYLRDLYSEQFKHQVIVGLIII
jgi:hypothetical protein